MRTIIGGSRIGLAAHYGKIAAREARWGNARNAEDRARLAAHHFMNVRGGIGMRRDVGGVCGCEYGELPTNMTRLTRAER